MSEKMSEKNKTKDDPPSHTIRFAPENDKHPWTRIGAMWPTKSGKGFQLKIEFVPTGPGRIFALPYEPETQEVETEDAGDEPKDKGGAVSKSSTIRNPVRNPIRP